MARVAGHPLAGALSPARGPPPPSSPPLATGRYSIIIAAAMLTRPRNFCCYAPPPSQPEAPTAPAWNSAGGVAGLKCGARAAIGVRCLELATVADAIFPPSAGDTMVDPSRRVERTHARNVGHHHSPRLTAWCRRRALPWRPGAALPIHASTTATRLIHMERAPHPTTTIYTPLSPPARAPLPQSLPPPQLPLAPLPSSPPITFSE